MRRGVALESLLVWVLAAAAVAAWGDFAPLRGEAPGVGAGLQAWRIAGTEAWLRGEAPLDPAPGLPLHLVALALARPLGLAGGIALAGWAAVGLGVAALWAVARTRGASLAAALVVALVGGLPAMVAAALRDGNAAVLAIPAVVLAIEARGRALGFVSILVCAAFDARLGAAAAIAAALTGGGSVVAFAALLSFVGPGASEVAADPIPWRSALPLGLVALAAAVGVREHRFRRAAFACFVLALGPTLHLGGQPVIVAGRAIPLPGIVLFVLDPDGGGWSGFLVVAAVAAALGLARQPLPRGSLLLAPLVLVEALWVAGAPLPSLPLRPSVAERFLYERAGAVLDLPVETAARTAPPGSHGLYLYFQSLHRRPIAVGPHPLGVTSPLYAEPGVVLAIDAALGGEPYLLPPAVPGEALAALGITEIAVHRTLFASDALALADPILSRMYGAPQRDNAGGVDLYRVTAEPAARRVEPTRLRAVGDSDSAGWRRVSEYLAALLEAQPQPGQVNDAGSN